MTFAMLALPSTLENCHFRTSTCWHSSAETAVTRLLGKGNFMNNPKKETARTLFELMYIIEIPSQQFFFHMKKHFCEFTLANVIKIL